MNTSTIHPLRAYRQAAGISLAVLAAQCATSTATISRIERGEQWPERELIRRLIDATGGKLSFNDFGEFKPVEAAT
jgi:transcriptional regulator with XRE-family HTH domain